jgi:hypothetical protein
MHLFPFLVTISEMLHTLGLCKKLRSFNSFHFERAGKVSEQDLKDIFRKQDCPMRNSIITVDWPSFSYVCRDMLQLF